MTNNHKLAKRRSIRKAEIAIVMDRMKLGYVKSCGKAFNVKEMKAAVEVFGSCECGCGQSFNGMQLEWDHKIPNAMQYEGDEIYWMALRKDCHLLKTKTDVRNVAKAKRMGGYTGQYARRKRRDRPLIKSRKEIQSRGFQTPPEGYSAWGKRKAYKSNVRYDD